MTAVTNRRRSAHDRDGELFVTIVGGLMLLLACGLLAYALASDQVLDDVGPATLPEWITAIATVGAVIAAIWAGTSAARTLRLERRRERRRRAAEERHERESQARLVAAWIDADEDRDAPAGFWIRNASDLPVTEFDLISRWATGQQGPKLKRAVIAPGGEPLLYRPRGAHYESWILAAHAIRQGKREPPWVAYRFVDAAGRHWERDFSGKLLQLPEAAVSRVQRPSTSWWI